MLEFTADCKQCGGSGKGQYGAKCPNCGGAGNNTGIAQFETEPHIFSVAELAQAITDLRTGSVPLDDDINTNYKVWALAGTLVALSKQQTDAGVPEGLWLRELLRGGGKLYLTPDGIWHTPDAGVTARIATFPTPEDLEAIA